MHKENRLAKREDFQKVYRRGKSFANHQFVVYRLEQREPAPLRLGVSVSKKVGNAVVRNRLRRTVKEIVRLNLDRLEANVDVIVIARKPVAEMEYAGIQSSLLHVLKRAGLLKKTR
ncbi:ribonuclease P protein component [Paenibacillus sp. J31TS4]|uniref:ribonuclease P protein component n=1 Tax=Paenibacillus sp. J31TS4 TaxID=2807195 RepID=UPI001B0D2DE2|nr:ribonuclease P protein component [Paenibacillus sp. J31TS4]GIP40646.1 ribonuclease P protein component [Paenibacillus sp. J31TS4]